ncbi:glycosyltransferase family 2 protein [Niveibacterium terrae]|uniref:glycosyltransferase family 2 protein n=1 Tax=Niveibacterium terrae TaxID=3373598 RepID=UPI003A922727
MKCCALVPVFNHQDAVGAVVHALLGHGLPVLLVDDGSDEACAAVLRALAAASPERVSLLVRRENGGKGAALIDGLRRAAELGFTHVLQIDADGQHDTGDVPRFLEAARQTPAAFICGCPEYDASVPKGRLYGRYLTHVWVWINTLSLRITDSMCGLRVYPLAPTLKLIGSVRIGRRMDFDTEILVRLDWAGVAIRNLATRVCYPRDGVSHFRPLADNVAISWMHTRLFFGMLVRLPRLLARLLRGQGRAL